MASTEIQATESEQDGPDGAVATAATTATIEVENPATGEVIATVPDLGADEIKVLAKQARAAQIGWEALGFDGRARIMRRAQKWILDNAERVLDTVVSETGKTYEDAQVADFGYTVSALGFWAKEGPKYLVDEHVPSWHNPGTTGKKVTDNVRALRQGAPTDVGTVDVGAVIFPPQLDIVDEHVRDAVDKGAKVLTGGHPGTGPGRFYEPTVLVDVDHSMKIMRDETFGPTLPIMKMSDAEQGVQLANDSSYGLQASVWTQDVERGESLARRIQAGVVCVNDAQVNYTALNLPMGGWKASGLGTRHGANGIRKYTKVQSLLVTRHALKREPFMFPYTRRTTLMLRRFYKLLYGRGSRD